MKLADIIVPDAIRAELKATTRDDAILELATALAEAGAITKKSVAAIAKATIAREDQATTGIGKGISLPHIRIEGIKKPMATIGCSAAGLDFNSLDGKDVHAVIFMVSSTGNPDEHLQAMEALFRHVQRDMFRKFLLQAKTNEAVLELIEEADEQG